MMKTSRSHVFISVGILAIYLALSVGYCPRCDTGTDEGYFANPAFNLLTKGHFGTTMLETFGTPFEGMDRHTYWVMPLQPLALSIWYRVFGFGVLRQQSCWSRNQSGGQSLTASNRLSAKSFRDVEHYRAVLVNPKTVWVPALSKTARMIPTGPVNVIL